MYKLLWKYTKDGWWAALLGPLFVVLEVIFDVYIPKVMALIVDVGIKERGGDIKYVAALGAGMVVLALLAGVTGTLSGVFASIASCKFVRNIREAIFAKIQTYDFKKIEKFPVQTVVMRMTTDMRQMRMAYTSIVRLMVRTPVNLIMSFIMVLNINKDLAKIFFFAIPILGFVLVFLLLKAHPRFVTLMNKYDALNGKIKESIQGIRVSKTFVRKDYENEKFEADSENVTKAQRFAENLIIINEPFFQLVMYACMIAIAWKGGNLIVLGDLSTGDFISYLSYLKAILFSLMGLSNGLLMIVNSRASVDRANELLDEMPDLNDDNADESLMVKDGSIEFKNVCFKYTDNANKNVLENINLKIESGETVGIIGPTGSSKTTLISLIPRLYDVTEGELLVGGENVKKYKMHNLREAVSVVLQKNTLFSGTILENMRWGNPDATLKEIEEACKAAQADDFIKNFKEGYNMELGQGGTNVSGGQKQRLCIARALLKKPKIIILDDSTSAVDTDTDRRIREALKTKLSKMTTIIIAQRVNSVKDADKIVILEEGKIKDIGTHDELLNRNNVYRDLYETQSSGVSE